MHILHVGRKVLYQYVHDNAIPSPVGTGYLQKRLRNVLKSCTEYLLTLPYCSRWTCSPSVADIADVFRILLDNNIKIILWILRQILLHIWETYFLSLSRVSSKSSISRIMRFLIRKITESYIHNLYSGTKLDNEIIIRSRKFSMLHVCFLLKQNFQNYCFLLYAWPTILLEYQMRPLLAERILRAPSPLHRIAWQHSRRVM